MRIKWPRRNLGTQSENWGRKVEQEIERISNAQETQSQEAYNNSQQTNSTLNNLTGIVQGLQATTERLDEQQQQILDTISKLSTASVWWAASSNVSIDPAPGYTDLATIDNLRVPDGYSKALILAVSQIDLTAYSPYAFEQFVGGVTSVIGGQPGWMMPVHGYAQYEVNWDTGTITTRYQATTSASASTVRYMENLESNQQIVVSTRADATGNVYGTATTSCQAIFFK